MLAWLGDKHDNDGCALAAELAVQAVDNAFAPGNLIPTELGGAAGTEAIFSAVMRELDKLDIAASE